MAVLCGWGSWGETGGRKQKAGDQTGREVKTGPWYSFGQNSCLRWKDYKLARKYAEVIKHMANNDNIGYDMDDRTSLYEALKKVNWDYKKINSPVECDCSELIACAINCVLKKEVMPSWTWTGSLDSLAMSTGYFKRLTGSKYLISSDYIQVGDILNNDDLHVISVLQDGAKAHVKGNTQRVAEPTLKKGCTGSEVIKLQSNLNVALNTSIEEDGIFGTETRTAVIQFQKKVFPNNKAEWDGVYGPKTAQMMRALIK